MTDPPVTARGFEVELRPARGRSLSATAKRIALRFAPTLLYRRPVCSLKPERLYAYLTALWERRAVEGAVVEIGCYLGGTAAVASQMLERTGFAKRYVCIDTFGGFVPSHFDRDASIGTSEAHRGAFSGNSLATVRRLLAHYGCAGVELIQADICELQASELPERISVCLVDVDLEAPTYAALNLVLPRLVAGGVILVDDCGDDDEYAGAASAFRRFMIEQASLPEEYFMGMGIVKRKQS